MRKVQKRQSTLDIKLSTSLSIGQLRNEQSKAMQRLMTCLGHSRPVYHCSHPIHDIQLLFLEVIVAATNLGSTARWKEMPQVGSNPSPEELKELFKLFGQLNEVIQPRAKMFEPISGKNKEWRRLGEAMHALYRCLQCENMIVGGEEWEDTVMTQQLAEGLSRAEAGEQAAVDFVREKWGVAS
ncbi:MAG: hypothetical protein J0L72_08625 [Armatimonadetes bacterium]|nr:hypothetical protein [Armatimonadota bacterium]